jgi:hypothetical protein
MSFVRSSFTSFPSSAQIALASLLVVGCHRTPSTTPANSSTESPVLVKSAQPDQVALSSTNPIAAPAPKSFHTGHQPPSTDPAAIASSEPVSLPASSSDAGALLQEAPTAPDTSTEEAPQNRFRLAVQGCKSEIDRDPVSATRVANFREVEKLLGASEVSRDDESAFAHLCRSGAGGCKATVGPWQFETADGNELWVAAKDGAKGLWLFQGVAFRLFNGLKCPSGLPQVEISEESYLFTFRVHYEDCETVGPMRDPIHLASRTGKELESYAWWDAATGERIAATEFKSDWQHSQTENGDMQIWKWFRPRCTIKIQAKNLF